MSEFDKVIGYKSIKFELERMCDVLKNFDKYKALGVKQPTGIMLYGDAGLGKTLMATCFVKESGWNCFVCRKDKSDGYFVKEIKRVYDEAVKNQPAIVLLDDFDKFSNEYDNKSNTEEFVTVQSCIDATKGNRVFTFATANRRHCFPDSLLRMGRFDKVIQVKAPEYEDAKAIIKYYLSQKVSTEVVDVEEVAKILGCTSCAVLENVVNEAAIYAGARNKAGIDMEDVVSACMRVIFEAPESLSFDKEKGIEKIAYHEAGHTVVAEILEPNSVNIVSVLKHDGDIGGVTSLTRADNYWQEKTLMENRVTCLLAGKAATEIVYGEVDTGVCSDVDRARKIVRRFYEEFSTNGFEYFCDFGKELSDNLKAGLENAMAKDLAKFYEKAKVILFENRKLLDEIAKLLVENKTIRQKHILEVKKKLEMC